MSQLAFLGATGALILGALAAVGMMSIWIRTNSKTEVTARTLIREAEDSITFLFEDETLSDATPLARDLMEFREAHRSDWENFLALLSPRFPHLRSQCGDLATVGKKRSSQPMVKMAGLRLNFGTKWRVSHWSKTKIIQMKPFIH